MSLPIQTLRFDDSKTHSLQPLNSPIDPPYGDDGLRHSGCLTLISPRIVTKAPRFAPETHPPLHLLLPLILALAFFFFSCVAHAFGSTLSFYVEGTYYGPQNVDFSLSAANNNFIKTFSNGKIIAGERKNGEAIYYFIDCNKKLITKISQENLYRIGEFTNWNIMVGLINLRPGMKLIRENKTDKQYGCTLYYIEGEANARACMDEKMNIPIYIEQNAKIIERISRVVPAGTLPDTSALLNKCIKADYRFIDADDDISPDSD